MKADMGWIDRHDPVQEVPAGHWEQGLPLGNGKIGAMVWAGSKDRPLTVSLDQAEIWELRGSKLAADKTWTEYKTLLEQGRGDELDGFVYDSRKPHLMRIPVGRLELRNAGAVQSHRCRLSLRKARCEGRLKTDQGAADYAVWISAKRQLVVIEAEEACFTPVWKFICRDGDYTQEDIADSTVHHCYSGRFPTITELVRSWGYPAMEETENNGIRLFAQEIPESGGFAVAFARGEGCWLISIQWSRSGAEEAGKMAIRAVLDGFSVGLARLRREHENWWAEYYKASQITIPDTRLEGYYYLETYMLACCTRPEGPHMTLLGPWTDDTDYPPICDNDYHWNNEQEMQIWPVYAGNRLAFAEPMYRMIEDHMDVLQETCRKHFKTDGAFLAHSTGPDLRPTCASVDNFELNGLPWVCYHYWKHYCYTMDQDFLRERAYPVMKQAVKPLLSELQAGEDGFLHLPWTSSPEYHGPNETLRWVTKEAPDWKKRFGPDATIDLALTRFLLKALCEASEILDLDSEDRAMWQKTLSRLTPYALDSFGGLAVRADVNLVTTHRHMSHLFPIYPIGEMTRKNAPDIINNSLNLIGLLGRGEWVGWTFPWAAIIHARGGRSAAARNLLLDFIDRYVTETGMHYQGPQGGCDISLYANPDGLFGQTIEAQLGAPEAVHELLMHSEDGIVRIFRDAPYAWAECGINNLRCEGAFLITAMRENYCTSFVRVRSEVGGTILIDTDLGDGELHGPVKMDRGLYRADLRAGEECVFWRGDTPNLSFEPLEGLPHEYHHWGVKRVRRF